MSELEQLRQEAEQLRTQIRVSHIVLYSLFFLVSMGILMYSMLLFFSIRMPEKHVGIQL